MEKLRSIFLLTIISGLLSGCFLFKGNSSSPTSEEQITSIKLDRESLTLDLYSNKEYTFELFLNDKKASNNKCEWSVSDEETLRVENGKVIPLAVGSAHVYATLLTNRELVADCFVAITDSTPVVTGVNIIQTTIYLDLYNKVEGKATVKVLGENNPSQLVNWSIDDESVATVDDNGKITALKVGRTLIHASPINHPGFVDQATISVTNSTPSILSFTLNKTSITLVEGDEFELDINVSGNNNPPKTALWSSSNNDVASVDANGLVTAKSEGSAVISAVSDFDSTKTASCNVRVEKEGTILKTTLKYTYDDVYDHSIYDIANIPNVGASNLLVLPILFNDSSYYVNENKLDDVKNDINLAFFGTPEETGWNSVKSFYETESRGTISLNGITADWYDCEVSSSTIQSTNDVCNIVLKATNWYFLNNPSDSRTNYDSDKDGYIDSVCCIYAVGDYLSTRSRNTNFWAFCYYLQSNNPNKSKPTPNTFFWASYDFLYDENTAYSRTGNSYGYGDCSHCKIDTHTFIHEMGHAFGLEDYYDYSYSCSPAGGFSMQDYNVGGHDPYSVMALGWTKPYIPTESCILKIKPFQEEGELILLSTHNDSVDSPFDEYLLIELFTPSGLNQLDSTYGYSGRQAVNATGIRLWHVDGRLFSYYDNYVGTDATHDGIVHAMSNTYGDEEGRISPLGVNYSNYNLLQLIRCDSGFDYKPREYLNEKNLFKAGDEFSMTNANYANQFYIKGKMNDGSLLKWSFVVNTCNSSGATITITKL